MERISGLPCSRGLGDGALIHTTQSAPPFVQTPVFPSSSSNTHTHTHKPRLLPVCRRAQGAEVPRQVGGQAVQVDGAEGQREQRMGGRPAHPVCENARAAHWPAATQTRNVCNDDALLEEGSKGRRGRRPRRSVEGRACARASAWLPRRWSFPSTHIALHRCPCIHIGARGFILATAET